MIEIFVMVMVLLLFLAVWIAVWGISAVRKAQQIGPSTREQMLTLAARAATDDSGRTLVQLLSMLDTNPTGNPVSVAWLTHRPVSGNDGMLVKITWDGNEWRQVYPFGELLDRLIANTPSEGFQGRAADLVRDLTREVELSAKN